MTIQNTPKKTPSGDWTRITIKRALEDAGWTMRGLSKAHGRAPASVTSTILRPWLVMELIIAEAIGVTPQEIWPSRWRDENGRLMSVQERKSNRWKRRSHVKNTRAA